MWAVMYVPNRVAYFALLRAVIGARCQAGDDRVVATTPSTKHRQRETDTSRTTSAECLPPMTTLAQGWWKQKRVRRSHALQTHVDQIDVEAVQACVIDASEESLLYDHVVADVENLMGPCDTEQTAVPK